MTAAPSEWALKDWTAEDLHHLPDFYRYEIVDGTLQMTPSASVEHNQIAFCLTARFKPQLPDGWSAVIGTDVIFTEDGRNLRRPDIVVYRREHKHAVLRAEDVGLVIEIVSPGSVTTDRVTKPAVYAAAGIPAYWRVEQEPALSLVEHQLTDMGKYFEHSPRAGVVKLDKPWPIEIDLDEVAREARG